MTVIMEKMLNTGMYVNMHIHTYVRMYVRIYVRRKAQSQLDTCTYVSVTITYITTPIVRYYWSHSHAICILVGYVQVSYRFNKAVGECIMESNVVDIITTPIFYLPFHPSHILYCPAVFHIIQSLVIYVRMYASLKLLSTHKMSHKEWNLASSQTVLRLVITLMLICTMHTTINSNYLRICM